MTYEVLPIMIATEMPVPDRKHWAFPGNANNSQSDCSSEPKVLLSLAISQTSHQQQMAHNKNKPILDGNKMPEQWTHAEILRLV